MPRTDRVTLTAKGLTMPSVDHLSNKSSLNVLLDRALSGQLAGVPRDITLIGLFTNFARLTRDVLASRSEYGSYFENGALLRLAEQLLVGVLHRVAYVAESLFLQGSQPRGAPAHAVLAQGSRVQYGTMGSADAVLHVVDRPEVRARAQTLAWLQVQQELDAGCVILAERLVQVIGNYYLNYRDLVTAMTKAHAAIEHIRGVPTGAPGPNFPNATLRTTHPGAAPPTPGTMRPSSYINELSRLTVTH